MALFWLIFWELEIHKHHFSASICSKCVVNVSYHYSLRIAKAWLINKGLRKKYQLYLFIPFSVRIENIRDICPVRAGNCMAWVVSSKPVTSKQCRFDQRPVRFISQLLLSIGRIILGSDRIPVDRQVLNHIKRQAGSKQH